MMNANIKCKSIKYACYFWGMLSLLPWNFVQAHPHSWIDLKTEIVGNGTHIQGFKMSWTFDAMTSAYMLDGEDLSPKNKSKTLENITSYLMENIKTEHYFTHFYEGENLVESGFSEQGVSIHDKTQLTLEFFLPLLTPKKITERPMRLFVYEASYYTNMSWVHENDVQLSSELNKHCSLTLIQPTPTEEQSSYATSLAANETPKYEQGKIFSQSINIICNK